MPDWNFQDIKNWKEQARVEQQFFCDRLGDRHYGLYETDEIKYLELNIGFAFYGSPKNVDKKQKEIKVYNYTGEQQTLIEKIRDKILDKTGREKIHVAFIFTNIKQHEEHYKLPIIRILGSNGKDVYFVDHSARVYTGWADFFKNNSFPKCIYCFPENGIYSPSESGNVKLAYAISPNCNLWERTVYVAYTSSSVARFAAIGMLAACGMAAFVCPTAALVLIAIATITGIGSRVYTVGRNAYKLDRGRHIESINQLTDAGVRRCCFGFVGGVFDIASMGVLKYTKYIAKNGDIACKALQVSYSYLEGASLSTNGLGIVCQVHDMVSKADMCTIKDIVKLSTFMLFYSNAYVSLEGVRTVITEVQNEVLANYKRNLRPEQREGFQKLVESTAGSKQNGNAKVIRRLELITHLDSFFKNVLSIQKEGAGHDIKLTSKGHISINEQLVIHPDKMMSIESRESRDKIFECTHRLQKDPSYAVSFKVDTRKICSQERIQFQHSRKNVISKFTDALGKHRKEFEINGKKIFKNLQPYEIDRLGNVMEISCRNYDPELLKIVLEFSSQNQSENVTDFIASVEFVFEEALNQRSDFKDIPNKKLKLDAVINRFKNSSSKMQDMLVKFNDLKSVVTVHNNSASPAFASKHLATYHYYKHKVFNGKELSPEQYYSAMAELFQNKELPQVKIMSQEGNKWFVTFTNSANGAKGVIIEPVDISARENAFVATFMYVKNEHTKESLKMTEGNL